MKDYLTGAIHEMIERARMLKMEIPRHDLPHDFSTLAQTSFKEIDRIITELTTLLKKPLLLESNNLSIRLRRFRRAVADFDLVENICVAALNRANNSDTHLNQIVRNICLNIKYPLLPPVVSCLSNLNYYHIYPKFNLLCVPLLEHRFLLHLPDLYHELAHPLLIPNKNDPLTEPFTIARVRFINEAHSYIDEELIKERRRNGPREFQMMLEVWKYTWFRYWAEELFCDLFAAFTLGPAFAWSHLHLSAKRSHDGNPYSFPKYTPSLHPPDHARMTAILLALQRIGFESQTNEIEKKWNVFLIACGAKKEPEYNRAFPDRLLEQCVVRAFEGITAIKCRIVNKETHDRVHTLLNTAWQEFWDDPTTYTVWEEEEVSKLRNEL